jgi:uncharacterized protein (TIGR02391 family)
MNSIENTKNLVREFRGRYTKDLEQMLKLSEKLLEVCEKIENSWSGSFAGWHAKMYFRDFQAPSIYERFSGEWGGINGIPDGWEEKKPEEVRVKIEELVGSNFSVEKFEDNSKQFRDKAEKLRTEVTIAFSSFNFDSNTTKEKELFSQIENFEFLKTKNKFISERLPKTLMSRDIEALRQGTCVPSWLYHEGVALEGKSISEAIVNFLDLSDRLIRQLEMKAEFVNQSSTKQHLLLNMHNEIYSKCCELYEKGAYGEAVEKGFKVVRDRLRKLTGYEKGSDAFGKGKLHIKGAAAPYVDQDFNNAVKFLTMAIDQFRNEKSHTSDARIDDPIRAYEYLRLSSLAMNLLENTEILP